MKKFLSLLLCLCFLTGLFALSACQKEKGDGADGTKDQPSKTDPAPAVSDESEKEAKKAEWREKFLVKANEVTVNEDSVTFKDATSRDGSTITVKKNPGKTVNLYASFTTLWYEAGGKAVGCIGGGSAKEQYTEYIGRDITADEGMTVVATTSSGKNWNTETILAIHPDLIICATSMSGYSTIQKPAQAAGVPVIAVDYDDFSDYLKWFKVFCHLNGREELWDSVAMNALEQVTSVLCEIPASGGPRVFSMFAGSKSLQANTSSTVVGAMVSAMGAVNIVDSFENQTGAERLNINLETVLAANPDIILVQCHADAEAAQKQIADTYGDNPVWQSLNAVKNGKVFYLEKALFHNKPNSRFAEAYEKLAAILYPDTAFSFQQK